ncbi:MAG: acetylornithine/succinylornithine family transaminase [Coriobacteriales bacterium]|jgi:acetylornithine aminotransferase|nr:acetylornithine/succinylornithine family transaminase [Coriobacteriales bacterium]
MSLQEEQRLDAAFLMQTYGRKPVEFVRGDGIRLYDDTGAEYLDFLAGVGAVSVGHTNPRVVKAIQGQAEKLLHVSNYYYVEGRGALAQKLSGLLNRGLPADAATPWRTFFANSGAEAVEGAIKVARKYGAHRLEGASTVIAARRSFHGRTLAALAATGQHSKRDSFEPIPQGFVHVDLGDVHALKALLHQGIGGKAICALLLEVIQGEGGVYPCTEEYLHAARELTAETGALLMLDEVQTGFYRTGERPFAFQHYGIVPDVVTLAKGLGAGVPIGALCARGPAAETFEPGDHGSTFGGSPLAVAAANAVLDELEALDIGPQVAEVGAYLQQQLKRLPLVTEVRGRGLMVGIELSRPVAEQVVSAGLEHRLVLNSIGRHILRFLPPLVCTKADVDLLIERLQKIMEASE